MSAATKKLIEATCPYCGGSLGEIWDDASISEFVCMIGHHYAPRELLAAHYEAQKRALWAAVRALEESANVANAAASTNLPEEEEKQLRAKADRRIEQAAAIRKIVQALEPL